MPGARLVITGEGSLDEQTLRGKAPAGVAAAARAAGIPVVAVAGRSLLSVAELEPAGILAAYPLSDLEPDPARSMAAAARAAGVPVVAVAGRSLLSEADLKPAGILAAYALTDIEPDPRRCMTEAGPLLERLATRVATDWVTDHHKETSSS